MRTVFMGTGDIGLPSLGSLLDRPDIEVTGVVTQPDRPAGRGKKLKSPEIKRVAEAAGVPVFQPTRLRRPESIAGLEVLAPDLIVVMAYGQILPKVVLDLPKMACLNLHASLLPRHRGAAPIQASILAGDEETGITVMYMAEGLDTGDMLLERRLVIGPRETAGELHDRLADLAANALGEAIDLLAAGNAPRTPQDEALASYAGKLTRESGEIDWSRPAVAADRLVRAMNPWPAAQTRIPLADGGIERLKVFRTAIAEASGEPGTVLSTGNDGIVIACGGGALLLEEVQGDGGRRMKAGDWARGRSVAIGRKCP